PEQMDGVLELQVLDQREESRVVAVAAGAGEEQAQIRPVLAQQRHRPQQIGVVLLRVPPADEAEQRAFGGYSERGTKRLAGSRLRLQPPKVIAIRDDGEASGIVADADMLLLCAFGAGDDPFRNQAREPGAAGGDG